MTNVGVMSVLVSSVSLQSLGGFGGALSLSLGPLAPSEPLGPASGRVAGGAAVWAAGWPDGGCGLLRNRLQFGFPPFFLKLAEFGDGAVVGALDCCLVAADVVGLLAAGVEALG